MLTFTKTRDVKSPQRGTDGSAGLDFFVPNDYQGQTQLQPGESVLIPSGIKVMVPYGYVGIFFNKSGVGAKGVLVGAQVIDSDYRGEVHINVHCVNNTGYVVEPGKKLVQMLIMPVDMGQPNECPNDLFDELYNNTKRGSGGFGSTGA